MVPSRFVEAGRGEDISERTECCLPHRSCCLVAALWRLHFDLLVLPGVIFSSAAIPSFEADASLEELK